MALVHPNVEYPVQYTFSVWYEESSTLYIVSSEEFIIRAQRIQNLSYALIQAGVKPGNRVAVIAPNSYVYFHGQLQLKPLSLRHCFYQVP